MLSCDHLAYVGGYGEFCGLYEFILNDPGNLTCIWPGGGSGYFLSGTTWSNDGRWFACEYNSGVLGVIDPETGEMEQIGGGGVSCNSLAWDPVNNRLYGTSGTSLIEYDPDTGEQTTIGSHFQSGKTMIALAIDSEGECYAWDVLFSGSSTLFWIDLESGQAYEVGSLGMTLTYAQDGDFCKEDDILYLAAYTTNPYSGSYLYECDEDTGSCTLVGQFQGDVEVAMFVIPWNYPPGEPSFPIPMNGSIHVPIDINLSWTCSDPDGDNITFDVYFGTTCPPPKVASNVTEYNPGILDFDTTYYWKIVARDEYGAETEGPIWCFTTEENGNHPPNAPTIDGPTCGKPGVEYEYTFVSTDPDGDEVKYYIDWCSTGDGFETDWHASGEEIILPHTWPKGTFTISAKAIDIYGAESDWGTLTVTMPRDKILHHSLLLRFLDEYPIIQGLIDILGRYIK